MNYRRFFSQHPPQGNHIRITDDEYHHLKHVNRAKCGDEIEVINGKGSLFLTEIIELKSDAAIVRVKKEEKKEKSSISIIIAPSILKQRSMNLMIEKLTEMGVDEIRPILFKRTDEPYSHSRLKKWQRIAIQSLKVNKRLWQTEILPAVTLDEMINSSQDIKTKILADISGESRLEVIAQRQYPVLAVIGPPGDMEEEERQKLIENGFSAIKINDCIMKSETAALSIAAIICLYNH